MNYLIIGNSAAGVGGIEGIRSVNKNDNITVITDEPYLAYSRPLISYYLADKVKFQNMNYRSKSFYEKNNVNLNQGNKAVKLNTDKKDILLNNGQKINYDKLLLTTGGKPFVPPIKGSDKSNIYTFLKIDDVKNIKNYIEKTNSKQVIILGGGLIGLKAAEAFIKKGLKVTVIELADRILNAILDKKAAFLMKSYLQNKGVEFYLSDTIESFQGKQKVNKVNLKSGKNLRCDLVVIAVGVRPNLSLVEDNNIDYNNGILVNKKLQTSYKDIYAAGDVCEGYNMLSGSTGVVPIWPNAYNQGFTAGQNMAGGNEIYQENFARNSISFFDIPLITAGTINPEQEDDYEIYRNIDKDNFIYKKILVKDNKLAGFILLNKVDRAGILTGLIKEQINIKDIKNTLLSKELELLSLNESLRKEKILN